MSLSKPFRLFDLPLLPLEQVLLPLDPRDLFFFALSSKKARELLRTFSLVKSFDIYVIFDAVRFSICFKSGKPINWKFTMKLPVNASEESRRSANRELIDGRKRTARLFKLDGMRMVLFEHPVEMRCTLPKEHFTDYIRRIGYLFQSICPGQRIRELGAGKVGWEDEKVLFHMDRNARCDEIRFVRYNEENLLEILGKTDVKRKITLKYDRFSNLNLEWMNNEKIRNIPELKLVWFNALTLSQFLSFENEYLHINMCLAHGLPNAFLKKWMNGAFTKRRTLRVTRKTGRSRLDDKVWDGLTQEPLETWEKLGKPGLVRFSDKLCLNPIPSAAHSFYRTVLLKNCHGQFATVVQTIEKFYFTLWDHPLPPINIPKGHKLYEIFGYPFAVIRPQNDLKNNVDLYYQFC